MPHIKRKRAHMLVHGETPENAGELNFIFTHIAIRYIRKHGKKYQNMNDVMGALEGCKLELYRLLISPYEDEKINQNGNALEYEG